MESQASGQGVNVVTLAVFCKSNFVAPASEYDDLDLIFSTSPTTSQLATATNFVNIIDAQCSVGSVDLYESDCSTAFTGSANVYADGSFNIIGKVDVVAGYDYDICVKYTDSTGSNVVT